MNNELILEILKMALTSTDKVESKKSLNKMIGEKVIIRTYSAGVWFGILIEKEGNEVILKNARRMRRWFSDTGTTLSEIANDGINQDKSQICAAVDQVWLEAIEIIPCSNLAASSIETAQNHKRD